MNFLLALVGTGLLCPISSASPATDARANGLLGDWMLVSTECGGKIEELPRELKGETRVTFTECQFIESLHGREYLWTAYRADPRRTPGWLDLDDRIGRKHTIYRIQGDTLTICSGDKPPTSFVSKPGDGQTVFTCRRKKP